MAVSCPSKLELNSPCVVANMHWSKLIHDDILDKHIESVLEVSCCCQGVLPDEFMLSFMMTKKLLNGLSIYPAPLNSIFYDICDPMVLQKGGEVFIEPIVATAQGEEHVERTTVLHLGKQLELLLGPISKSN